MGKKVTVVEMLPECGKDVFFINKITLFTKLAENGVELMTNTKVVSIEENGLTVEKQDKTTETVLADCFRLYVFRSARNLFLQQ